MGETTLSSSHGEKQFTPQVGIKYRKKRAPPTLSTTPPQSQPYYKKPIHPSIHAPYNTESDVPHSPLFAFNQCESATRPAHPRPSPKGAQTAVPAVDHLIHSLNAGDW
jgi:hypothetical protein